ncbi:MAG TPA: gephyrin-like molybdotransferase Glp [Thermomicrobiaceae bacterium]|nr:gephyrin-like molybdotransferase Glp [Thermomicrobiaceae bacterium]
MDGAATRDSFETTARQWDDPQLMLDVDAVRTRIIAGFEPLDVVTVPLLNSLGLVLADDVVAGVSLPPFTNSAMDGYALRAVDTQGASVPAPARLVVVGQQPAGRAVADALRTGECVRIMTGAPLPAGADAVARFEEVRAGRTPEAGSSIMISRPISPGENVREIGEDLAAGQLAISAGTVIRSGEIGLLAALNRERVPVRRRPVVGILSTGDEVRGLGEALEPGEIHDSNSYLLAALVQECGGRPLMLGVARDRVGDLRERFGRAQQADLLVTSGGVSVGDFDLVKEILRDAGTIEFWQVRMKPGKPIAFGRVGRTPVLGLPGNPAAAAVAFIEFGWPAVRTMLGYRDPDVPSIRARLAEPLENRGGRRHFVRGLVERHGSRFACRIVARGGSGSVTSMASANGLIVVPETVTTLDAGAEVDVHLLPPGTLPA